MDYEKKYNEALKRAKAVMDMAANQDEARGIATTIFPELRESEDERTRKWLVNLVENLGEPADEDAEKELEEMRPLALAYLEKQKDHFRDDTKKVEKQDYSGLNDLERAIHRGFLSAGVENVPVTIIKETAKECLAQMKPAEWSEEDDKMLVGIIERGSAQIPPREPALRGEQMEWLMNRLKSLRPQPHWKPSEQEKGALRTAIHILTEERSFPKAAGHLQAILDAFEGKESRKDWKPSEGQIQALEYVVSSIPPNYLKEQEYMMKLIGQVIQQLKKL